MKTESYIGLGSNLDNPQQQLKTALATLHDIPDIVLQQYSSFYRSKPLGPQGQADFINAVAQIASDLSAPELLARLQQIETGQGRVRGKQRWGPRTLDIDILLYGDEIIDKETLTVPHPQIRYRNFVLLPLLELAPDIDIPGQGKAAALLQRVGTAGLDKIAAHE